MIKIQAEGGGIWERALGCWGNTWTSLLQGLWGPKIKCREWGGRGAGILGRCLGSSKTLVMRRPKRTVEGIRTMSPLQA